MNKLQVYNRVFMDCFGVGQEQLTDQFVYQCVPQWDSVGHMGMITAIEDSFNIVLETDDIVDFGSYTKGIDILRKYNVFINE